MGVNNRLFSSWLWRLRSSRSRWWQIWFLARTLFQLCNLFAVSSHGKEGTFLSSSSCKAFNSIIKALPAWSHLTWIIFQRSHLQIQSVTLRIRASQLSPHHWNWKQQQQPWVLSNCCINFLVLLSSETWEMRDSSVCSNWKGAIYFFCIFYFIFSALTWLCMVSMYFI